MTKQISLRLPDELHQRVTEAAKHDARSMHGEILWLIDHGLGGFSHASSESIMTNLVAMARSGASGEQYKQLAGLLASLEDQGSLNVQATSEGAGKAA